MKLDGRDVTIDTVVDVKREALEAFRMGDRTIDFSGVGRLDSTVVALLLALLRCHETFRIEHPTEDLRTLVRLYGVADLFADSGL